MKAEQDIEAINLREKTALLTDGRTIPITNFIGSDGDECKPNCAVVVVAGDEGVGWWTIDLREYENVHLI